jgi:hypothetical protein
MSNDMQFLYECVVIHWHTTLAGVAAGALEVLTTNGGAMNATLEDWARAAAIAAIGLFARSVADRPSADG